MIKSPMRGQMLHCACIGGPSQVWFFAETGVLAFFGIFKQSFVFSGGVHHEKAKNGVAHGIDAINSNFLGSSFHKVAAGQ